MFINAKEELINYFHKGAKKELFIGVENEKFLFDQTTNSRADYSKVKEVLNYLKKFGCIQWVNFPQKHCCLCLLA